MSHFLHVARGINKIYDRFEVTTRESKASPLVRLFSLMCTRLAKREP